MTTLADLPRDGMVYVGVPYTNYTWGRDASCEDASIAAAGLMKRGLTVYSPISHTHQIAEMGNMDPTDHDLWVKADEWFVNNASALVVVMLDGWEDSRGLTHEISEFRKAGKPICFLKPGEISDEG